MGLTELLLLGALFYLLFGSNRLSKLKGSVSKAFQNFKESTHEIEVDPRDIKDDPELIEKQNQKRK